MGAIRRRPVAPCGCSAPGRSGRTPWPDPVSCRSFDRNQRSAAQPCAQCSQQAWKASCACCAALPGRESECRWLGPGRRCTRPLACARGLVRRCHVAGVALPLPRALIGPAVLRTILQRLVIDNHRLHGPSPRRQGHWVHRTTHLPPFEEAPINDFLFGFQFRFLGLEQNKRSIARLSSSYQTSVGLQNQP